MIARGDVIVDGVVEDALIQSGGQVIIKRGIHGMHKGIIDAEGNVITQFIENATIFSGGYVETGSSIYSEVNASQDVIVNDHKGFIAGGVIRAGGKVESHTMGSSMGALTRIEVGMAPEKKEQYTMLQRDIAAKKAAAAEKAVPRYAGGAVDLSRRRQERPRLLPQRPGGHEGAVRGRQTAYGAVTKVGGLRIQAKWEDPVMGGADGLQNSRELFNTLHQELLNSQHAKVVVRRDVFPGVTIVISDISVTVKEKRSFCQFTKSNNQIHISTL